MIVHKIRCLATAITSVLFLLFLSFNVFGAEGMWGNEIESILEKNGMAKDQYGIEIRNVTGNQVYFSSNATRSFNPASTMKILVSIIALEKLGPHYRFATLVKKQGKDLCLVGQGDPSLVYEDLFLLTEQLLREPSMDKKSINHIFVDESFFPTTRQYDDDFDGDGQRSFTAPLSSLSLNYNSVTVFVKPGSVGEKPEVYSEPRSSYFVIRNQAKTVQSGEKTINARIQPKDDKIEITVTGQISTKDNSIIYRAIPEPALYAGSIFKDLLQRTGVTVSGSVEKKMCSQESQELVRFQSKPLSQIIMGMNKFSNNFIAETLMYHLGDQATSKSGLDKMIAWAKSKNLPLANVNVENASGLSRANSVTPLFLWSLFSYGRNTFQTYPELLTSFPIGGLDGTLKRRFHSNSTEGLVRAKSGSLKNTVSLVGSIQTVKKGELLFVFLFETRGKTMGQIQSMEEKILEKVAALGQN